MLEQLDLSRKLAKAEYRERMEPLRLRVAEIGRAVFASHTPVVIVFEGWSTAGKGPAISELTWCLDPRGYRVYPISAPAAHEQQYPWLQRFYLKIPARGEIAIFHGSWYRRVLFDHVARTIDQTEWLRAYEDIEAFERTLAEDGTVLIKFWLHIDRDEQRLRLQDLLKHESTAWRVCDEEHLQRRQYEEYRVAAEDMFGKTDAEYAPWTLVAAADRRWMKVQVFETICARLEAALAAPPAAAHDSAVG